jgi:hypothetical protein
MLSIPQKSLRPEAVMHRSAATIACSIFLRLSNRIFEIRKEGQNRHPLTNQNRHLSDRLIRTIESSAEEFAQSTVKKLRSSSRTESYHKLPDMEIYDRCYEVYRNLGRWLWEKSEEAIQARFNELGESRCQEGIPLAEVLWALVLTKDRLLEYVGACSLADSAIELYQQQELDRLIGRFFDRAVCYTAASYERQASEKKTCGEDRESKHSRTLWPQGGFFRNGRRPTIP